MNESSPRSDYNFCFPTPELKNDRVSLVPFELKLHLQPYWEGISGRSELYHFVPWGPFYTMEQFRDWHDENVGQDSGCMLFAISTTCPGELAGVIALRDTHVFHLKTEIAFLVILPQYQRKGLARSAISLLLHYALDPKPYGLGLRRVTYYVHSKNQASCQLATRMGFSLDGIMRCYSVLPLGKCGPVGNEVHNDNGSLLGFGADAMVFSICWDQWDVLRLDKLMEVSQINPEMSSMYSMQ